METGGFLDLDPDPLRQFRTWLAEAQGSGIREPTAMALATADATGRPSVRMVLMRGLDERGLAFYTNRESRKGTELAANPRAAAVFYWDPLGRQVRVEGDVEALTTEESEVYFVSRPWGSRIAAWASRQSRPLADRATLEERYATMAERHGGDVPLPTWWGGYRLRPDAWEFWAGRPDRLHDRLLYTPDGSGGWTRQRLYP